LGLIVDSSVIIAVERVGQTAYQLLENLRREAGDQEIGVSTITILELAHGVTRANTQQRRSARKQFLDELLVGIPVHAVDTAVALRAGEIDGSLHAQGGA
jgi:tRNA(fMet)-specific endonuclease VapC